MVAGRSLQQQVVNPMEKRVKVLKLTPHDNVGTALQDLKKGDTFQIILDGKVIGEDTAKTEIPFGFKPKSRRKTPRNPVRSRSFKLKVRETHGLFIDSNSAPII